MALIQTHLRLVKTTPKEYSRGPTGYVAPIPVYLVEAMLKWIVDGWNVLLHDEKLARRVTRALFIGFGLSTPGLVLLITDVKWKIAAYMVGGLVGAIGGLIGAGTVKKEKNAKPTAVP